MYSDPMLEQIQKQLQFLDAIDSSALLSLIDITKGKVTATDGFSNYIQIKGRSNTPENAKALVTAVCDAIITRHDKLFAEALEKFNFEIKLIGREKESVEFLINQKQKELTRIDADVKHYEDEIKKREKVESEAQGRIVESYISLLAVSKNDKENRIIELENLKHSLENFDVRFQQKDFEKKYQTKSSNIEVSANLQKNPIAPDRKKNIALGAVFAAFIAIFYAFVAEFIQQHKAEFKKIKSVNVTQADATSVKSEH